MREFTRSQQLFKNPDEDFVLHGQRASYSEKPLALRNSRLTTTSSRLSQHVRDSQDNYRDRQYAESLGASYELSDLDRKLEEIENKPRPRTAKPYIKTSYDPDSVNSMYLMSSEAPATRQSSPLYTSPYVTDLSTLRMERLRIEEDRYLELKRLQELERLRGPKQKWYESAGPDFHYESHKNTELIKSQKHFDKLQQYKEELRKSSTNCRKSYEAFA